MEKLLNAEVIKAAASSNLGTLSLMCLILCIVALTFFKNAPVRAKVLVFVLLLMGVAGFGYSIINQKSLSPPEATRQFAVGRWQVEQKVAGIEGGSFIDYFEDGSFSGRQETFINGRGQRVPVRGAWDLKTLAKDQFSITLKFDNGNQWQGIFRVVDHNRIHNIDENYDAVRVPN